MATRHVVLVTYGEPATAAFLPQLAYSWRILLGLTRTVADIPAAVLPLVAVSRGLNRNRAWTAEAYGSPLEAITLRQAQRLRQALTAADGGEWNVHVAYEFRRPLLPEVLRVLPGHQDVFVVPMYATESAFTHALSRNTAAATGGRRGEQRREGRVSVLTQLDTEALAEVSASHVLQHTARDDAWRGPGAALVMAAHGTLLDPPRPIDTGLAATEALAAAIKRRLSPHFGLIVNGWLNHVRGGRWTQPPIDEALTQVVAAGFQRVVYFPYGFLADNAETQLEGRVALRAKPGIQALHLPCLNESAHLVAALTAQILDAAV